MSPFDRPDPVISATDLEEMLLADPERAIGFGGMEASLDIFHRWFSTWFRG